MKLTARQRVTYVAHLYKAAAKQYYRNLIPWLGRIVPDDAIVADIGAHGGHVTRVLSRIVSRGHVYSFEPSPYALSILRTVRAIRRLNNVTIVPVALGASQETGKLNIPIKRSGSIGFGLSHIQSTATRPRDPHATEERADFLAEPAVIDTLDNFVRSERIAKLTFLKADIEGWELNMLKGAAAVLRNHRPILMLEINTDFLRRAGDSKEQLFRFLDDRSYVHRQIHGFGKNATAQPTLVESDENGDYFCVPAERAEEVHAELAAT